MRRCAVGCVRTHMLRQICTIFSLADVHLTSLRKNINVLPDQRSHGLGGMQRKILRTNERFPSILGAIPKPFHPIRGHPYCCTRLCLHTCRRACSLFHHCGCMHSAITLAGLLRLGIETYMSAVLLSENPYHIKIFSIIKRCTPAVASKAPGDHLGAMTRATVEVHHYFFEYYPSVEEIKTCPL